jgi:hypothetical protein
VSASATNIKTLYTAIESAFSVKTHVLFEGISTPYDKLLVNTGAPSSAMPLWWYQKDTAAFVEWSPRVHVEERTDAKGVSLPILSMTIVAEERIIHDLTDFVERVRVFHRDTTTFPSVAHIIGAWSLSSGIVLNTRHEYFANIITNNADTMALPVNTHEYYTVVQTASDLANEVD